MKKNKLESEYEIDFDLIGLVYNGKAYKLAWHLNKCLGINLVKKEDIRIEFFNHTSILVSNFKFETDYVIVELLQNKLVAHNNMKSSLLVPELKQIDYFLKVKDATGELTSENVNAIIKQISIIEYALSLNFESLRSKENLLY